MVLEILERKLAFAQLFFQLDRLLFIHHRLGLFNERQHVAHAKDGRGHAVWVKRFQLFELFTDTDELDRFIGDGLYGQCRPTTGITVHLGEDDAADIECFVKRFGNVDRILAGHGVGYQQDVRRCHRLLDGL